MTLTFKNRLYISNVSCSKLNVLFDKLLDIFSKYATIFQVVRRTCTANARVMSFYWHKFVLAVNAVWHYMYHHWEETVIFEVSLLLLLQRLLRFESECTSLFSRNNPETILKECSKDDSNPDTFWVFLTPFTWSSRLRYQGLNM